MKKLLVFLFCLVVSSSSFGFAVPYPCEIPMLPGHTKLYQTDFNLLGEWDTAGGAFAFDAVSMNTASSQLAGTLRSGPEDKSGARLDLVQVLGEVLELSKGPLAVYVVLDSYGLSHDVADPTVVLHKAGSGGVGNLAGASFRPAASPTAPDSSDAIGEKDDHGDVAGGTNAFVEASPGVWKDPGPQTFAILYSPMTGGGADDMGLQLYHLVSGAYDLKMDNSGSLNPADTAFDSTSTFDYLDICFRGGNSATSPSVAVVQCVAISQIPEPATIALLGFGAVALIRRKR